MNIIFLTVSRFKDVESRGIYEDLIRKFRDEGHCVYVVSPCERRYEEKTELKSENGIHILGVKTLNMQKTNFIEKGIATILFEYSFKSTIAKYLSEIKFDLVLYSTPPITLGNIIKYIKKGSPKAKTYLMLKDIFPQNAVDLGFFSKKSLFYKYFRWKEKQMYVLSDFIGCMSPANVDYVLENNSFIDESQVDICPNSIELQADLPYLDRNIIRSKYNLPIDKPIFIYGGNLGKPQGISFLIDVLRDNKERSDLFFLIVGDGTEYVNIEKLIALEKPKNLLLIKRLPKNEYDLLVRSCDVGLIFLDNRFSIPNYPSRLLSYLEYKMPIVAATDNSTDIGSIAVENRYGFSCESKDVESFNHCLNSFLSSDCNIKEMGENGYKFLVKNYLVQHSYNTIVKHINTDV